MNCQSQWYQDPRHAQNYKLYLVTAILEITFTLVENVTKIRLFANKYVQLVHRQQQVTKCYYQ